MSYSRINMLSSAAMMIGHAAATDHGSTVAKPDWVTDTDTWNGMSEVDRLEAIANPDDYMPILGAVEGDEDDTDEDEGDGTDATSAPASMSAQHDPEAITAGRKLSATTTALLREGYEHKEKLLILPLRLYDGLKADFGDEGMAALPKPGSKKGETGNSPYDKFTYKVDNGKGGERSVNGSFYGDMFDTTDLGVSIIKDMHGVDLALANDPAMPHAYKELGKYKLNQLKSKFTSRRTFGIGQLKKAVNIDRQCQAFDAMDKVGYRFEMEAVDGKLTYKNIPQPVVVYDLKEVMDKGKPKLQEDNHRPITLNTFLKLDVFKAMKAGGTKTALMETVGRSTKQTPPKTVPSISTGDIKRFEHYMAEISAWLEQPDNYQLVQLTLGNPATDGAFFLTLGDIKDRLEVLADRVDRRINQERDRVAAMDKAEREAKAAAKKAA